MRNGGFNMLKVIKKHLTLVIVIAVLAVAAAIGAGMIFSPTDIDALTVSRGTIKDQFDETGIVHESKDQAVVSAVAGKVLKVKTDVGKSVKTGDVIATVDTDEYETQLKTIDATISSCEAQIDQEKQENEKTKASIKQDIDQLQISLVDIELDRQKTMYENSFKQTAEEYLKLLEINSYYANESYKYSKQVYDDATNRYNSDYDKIKSDSEMSDADKTVAEADLNKTAVDELHQTSIELEGKADSACEELNEAREKIAALGDNPDEAYLQHIQASYYDKFVSVNSQKDYLNRLLKQDTLSAGVKMLDQDIQIQKLKRDEVSKSIDDCTITAPCDGTISALPVQNIDRVAEQDQLAVIKKGTNGTVECHVLTSCIPYLKKGDEVTLVQKLRSSENHFSGKISSINDYTETSTSALGLTEYRVTVNVEPEDGFNMVDGSDVEADFTIYNKDNVLVLPVSAVFTEDDVYYVYKVEGGRLVKTKVDVAYRSNEQVEIAAGIKEGDVVAKDAGSSAIEDGMSVKAIIK